MLKHGLEQEITHVEPQQETTITKAEEIRHKVSEISISEPAKEVVTQTTGEKTGAPMTDASQATRKTRKSAAIAARKAQHVTSELGEETKGTLIESREESGEAAQGIVEKGLEVRQL